MSALYIDNINEIIDNEFMDKDVSELVKGDFYLFHVEELEDTFKTYFWKDGVLFVADSEDVLFSIEYTKGSLKDYVDSLGENN